MDVLVHATSGEPLPTPPGHPANSGVPPALLMVKAVSFLLFLLLVSPASSIEVHATASDMQATSAEIQVTLAEGQAIVGGRRDGSFWDIQNWGCLMHRPCGGVM